MFQKTGVWYIVKLMKTLYFHNLYEVNCSLGLVFLQYPIRYAESTQSLTEFVRITGRYCNSISYNVAFFRVADRVL